VDNKLDRVPDQSLAAIVPAAIDVLIVGGGFAGLGAALTLGRARRSVVVVDAGHPRNAPAKHSHGYLSRDGMPPLELLSVGRRELAAYGVEIVEGEIVSLERSAEGRFKAAMSGGTHLDGRRVLVATGLVDELPDVPGLRERWGRDVVHCPFCFGWELRDMPLGILATGPRAAEQALMWRQWSPDLILFLHTSTALTDEQAEQLAAMGVRTVEGEVAALEVTEDRLTGVRLRSGQVFARSALVVGPRFEARHSVLDGLGAAIAVDPLGLGSRVAADASGRAAPGVWVAGNVADVTAGVLQAAASGITAAAAINADLTAEDVARALDRQIAT
jgi:thioredoxin reductase